MVAVARSLNGDYASVNEEILHCETPKPAIWSNLQMAHEKRLVFEIEGFENIQPQCSPDEPWRREFGCGPNVVKAETLLHHASEVLIADTQ